MHVTKIWQILMICNLYNPRMPSSWAILLKADDVLLYGTTHALIPWVWRKIRYQKVNDHFFFNFCITFFTMRVSAIKKEEYYPNEAEQEIILIQWYVTVALIIMIIDDKHLKQLLPFHHPRIGSRPECHLNPMPQASLLISTIDLISIWCNMSCSAKIFSCIFVLITQ